MNIIKYLSDIETDEAKENLLAGLSEAHVLAVSKTILHAGKIKLDEVRHAMEDRPSLNNDDLKKDFRYQLGMIAGIQWILDLPEVARGYIIKRDKGDK